VEQGAAAAVLGIKPEQVKINTLYAGGSFGRRATTAADYIVEAVAIAKASGGGRPIHLVWTREDDIKGGYYRPMVYHKVRAGLDKDGAIVAWDHHIVAQQIMEGTSFEGFAVRNGVDMTTTEGVADIPYAVPNIAIAVHPARAPVPVLWWRSVGHTHTAQVVEVMIDDLARAAGKDPVAFRLALLGKHPRHAGVRSAHCRLLRGSDRRRRAGRAGTRASSFERRLCRDRQALALAALRRHVAQRCLAAQEGGRAPHFAAL